MESEVGLWIDHRKCIMVFINNKKTAKRIIESHAEKHPGRINHLRSLRPFESLSVKADDRLDRHFSAQLNDFFKKVFSHLGNAGTILIFGPGDAKRELLKYISSQKLNGYTEELECADKMTEDQIVAKVKEHFSVLQK